MLISTATSTDEATRSAKVAVLPVGSFEQHGSHLPLSTDTLIAATIAHRIATDYRLLLLPPVTISCSHEHSGFAGTVSISASTLNAIVTDIAASLRQGGVPRLAIVNAHGGNYVLSNVVQQANVCGTSTILFPRSDDWSDARRRAGVTTNNHEDMHAGEAETSILLAAHPESVRPEYRDADNSVDDRRHLLTIGMSTLAPDGVIGRPSLASAEKGKALLDAFSELFASHLELLKDLE